MNPRPLPRWAFPLSIAAIVVGILVDPWVGSIVPDLRSRRFSDLHNLVRLAGYLPTWILIFATLWIAEADPAARRPHLRRGIFVVGTAGLAGLLAAALKILVRRPQPPKLGPYEPWTFAPFGDAPFDGTDFGFPSEHAAVAWGAAIAWSRLHPQLAPVLLPLAFATGWSRVVARGHHPSDVLASSLVALVASLLVVALLRRTGWIDSTPSDAAASR